MTTEMMVGKNETEHENHGLTQQGISAEVSMPVVIDFLIEDFKDTSEHLKATDKKVEFLFQLYGGTSTFFTSIIVALISTALNSSNQSNATLIISIAPQLSLALLAIIWIITWWLFEYMLRGLTMKSLYVNRLNFLRGEVYKRVGEKIDNAQIFYYVGKVLPDSDVKKVKMGDMFILALRWIIISVWLFFSILLFSMLNNKITILGQYIFSIVSAAIFFALVFFTKHRWKKSVIEARAKIEKSWNKQSV